MKKRYGTITGHCTNHLEIGISHDGGPIMNYSAFYNGGGSKQSFGAHSAWHCYSSAHQFVRARRIALMAVFFVELMQESK